MSGRCDALYSQTLVSPLDHETWVKPKLPTEPFYDDDNDARLVEIYE